MINHDGSPKEPQTEEYASYSVGEPPVAGSATGYAALVKQWRDCAKGIADNYWKLRHVAPDAAERAKARSETYADCANQLEEAMRHNAKLSRD